MMSRGFGRVERTVLRTLALFPEGADTVTISYAVAGEVNPVPPVAHATTRRALGALQRKGYIIRANTPGPRERAIWTLTKPVASGPTGRQ